MEHYETLIDYLAKYINKNDTSVKSNTKNNYDYENELYLRGYTKINYRTMENAIDKYNIEKFMVLFDNGLDPNGYQEENFTPLTYLLLVISNKNFYSYNEDSLKYIDFINLLFEYGADINKSDGRGNIPIIYSLQDSIPFKIFKLLLHNLDLILNEELIQDMLSSIKFHINSEIMAVNISVKTKKKRIHEMKIKRDEIMKMYNLPIAQQRLATMRGYKDQNSILSTMNPDIMESVSKYLSTMKVSPSVKKKIKKENNSSKKGGKSKSKKTKKYKTKKK